MQSALYPLKFLPLYKQVVWGGNRLKNFDFDYDPLPNCGELWALSTVEGRESVVANGFLADNTLVEAIEVYTADLVGERVFRRYGITFPLLVKLIDAAKDLSVQVHPDDALAQRRGMPCGKTEMWYVMQADPGAKIICGFDKPTTPEAYRAALESGHIEQLLHVEEPKAGDVCFLPAGRVHALGKGLMVAEVQQTSDCTYRIYDYNRLDSDGHPRQLHVAEAMEAIDFNPTSRALLRYQARPNATCTLVRCDHFVSNLLCLDTPMRKNLEELDTAVVYLCVEGLAAVRAMDTIVPMHVGECVMVPAVADSVELFCEGKAKLIECYVDPASIALPDNPEPDWMGQFMASPSIL